MNELYGGRGIDTPYEREKIEYRPDLSYTKEYIASLIQPEVKQALERSRTFTISHNLREYDELAEEIDQLMKDIEQRNHPELMSEIKEYLSQKQYKKIFSFESKNSGYQQTGDFELYSLLFMMKASVQNRRDFIDDKFRTQITEETDIDRIEEKELASIEEWEALEARVMEGYKRLGEHEEDYDEMAHSSEDDSLHYNHEHLSYEELEELDDQKRNKEIFHTTMADTSYIHRNRYFMFLEVVEKAKIITHQAKGLISDNLKELIISVSELNNYSSLKTHLIHQFKKIRTSHESLKGRIMTIDDGMEDFGSEKNYLYQQMEAKSMEPVKKWLYEQEEEVSGAIDKFAGILVESMKDVRVRYEESLGDLLNFYKSEADFFEKQIYFLKEKEEIRQFYRILEDLEEVEHISSEWISEYLQANGYEV